MQGMKFLQIVQGKKKKKSTWVGAALLTPQEFEPRGEEERLGKKDHPPAGQCLLDGAGADSSKMTLAQPYPCSHHPQKHSGKGSGRGSGRGLSRQGGPPGMQSRSWNSVQRPGGKIHICLRFMVCWGKWSTDIFKTWGH